MSLQSLGCCRPPQKPCYLRYRAPWLQHNQYLEATASEIIPF